MPLFIEKLLIKEVCQFLDFFSEYAPYDKNSKAFKAIPFGGKATIGNYLEVCRAQTACRYFYNVKPTDKLVELINNHMISVDYDQIYFTIMIYPDNTAMLIMKYNQIIGSRWIAMIDINSIPNNKYEKDMLDRERDYECGR